MAATEARIEAEEALVDAAERLLVSVGHASITTRLVAKEAGVNHGLVHYYFGSMENLLLRVLERFTEREQVEIEISVAEAAEAITAWLASGDLDGVMTRFHSRWTPGPPPDRAEP